MYMGDSLTGSADCAQLMSLLRTYDVTWPTATQQTLSWSDTLNVGLSVAAPGCWIPHYNFYVFYLIQMAMPASALRHPAPPEMCCPSNGRCSLMGVLRRLCWSCSAWGSSWGR